MFNFQINSEKWQLKMILDIKIDQDTIALNIYCSDQDISKVIMYIKMNQIQFMLRTKYTKW